MRSSVARAYSLLFFLSGATGLVYELLWVRVLYQTFGSTIQSVTTVVAAYMGGLGLGAWLLGRRADRHERPAALYGRLEIAIGVFGLASPLVLALAHRIYVGTAAALALHGAASVALRFALAGAVLLIPTTLMGGTLPVLPRAFTGTDRAELQRSLGLLYGLNTLGAVVGTALAGFFLIEYVGVRASLWGTAAGNLAIGIAALRLPVPAPDPGVGTDPGRKPGDPRDPVDSPSPLLRRAALVLTAAGAGLLFLIFGLLPRYIIAVFQVQSFGATERLLAMGLAVGAVVLIPAIGMGMTFPLLTDLVAERHAAGGSEVGRAY